MQRYFRRLASDPELRRKQLFAVGLCACYVVGLHLRIPGVGPEWTWRTSATSSLPPLLFSLVGANPTLDTLFALGVLPQLCAALVFPTLVRISPEMQALRRNGAGGRARLHHGKRVATLLIAIALALLFYFQTVATTLRGEPESVSTVAVLVGSLVAGSAAVTWIVERMRAARIESPLTLLVIASLASHVPRAVWMIADSEEAPQTLTFFAGIWLFFIAAVLAASALARRLVRSE